MSLSNLHRNSTESNKHTPKGFTDATNNSKLIRDERGESRYVDNINIGTFIDFADPTIAPPTTTNNHVYVLVGAGTVDADWGSAVENDIVRFFDGVPIAVTPTAGYFGYNLTENKYYRFTTDWIEFAIPPVWGSITGTLSDQTDLQTALDNAGQSIYNGVDVSPLTKRNKLRFSGYLEAVDDAVAEETQVDLSSTALKESNVLRFGVNGSNEVDLKITENTILTGDSNGFATTLTGTEGSLIGFGASNEVQEFTAFEAFNILKETGITADKTLALIGIDTVGSNLKATFAIDEILLINTTANSVTVNVGSTALGTDIVNAVVVGANATVLCGLGTRYFSSTVNQDLYISSGSWNSANLTISVTVKKVYYV
jgi:hypothetical protein